MIELEQLQQAWDGLQERYEQQGEQLRGLQRRRALADVGMRLRRLSRGLWWQLGIGIAIVLWAGGYWFDHRDAPHLFAYGVSIHVFGLALLVGAVLQLVRLARIDYEAPLLEVQQHVQRLGRLRIAIERALLVAAFVAWVPMSLVALRAAGIDLWLTRPEAVWLHAGVGLALAAAVAWITRRWRVAFERDALGALGDAARELQAMDRGD